MVVDNRKHSTADTQMAVRIAAWLALAVIYAIAFHYAKKYEGDMLTDHFQTTVPAPDDAHRYGLRQPPSD